MTLLCALLVAVAGPGGWHGLAGNARSGQEAAGAPAIELVAAEGLATQAERLARVNGVRLAAVMRLVGLEDAGPTIPVFLLPEDAPVARQSPAWVAGFASEGKVVIFPARTPTYPHESLEDVLQHEVAHVLIDRAAGGRRVPRWFHEGVALAAERTWSLGDRTHFALDVALGGTVDAASLDRLFEAPGRGTVERAYRLSGLLVSDLHQTHGPDLAARVLRGTRSGKTFDAAFFGASGLTVDEAVDAFWHRRRLWVTWLPWLTSGGAVWTFLTLLALAAFVAERRRRARRRWDEEEDQGERENANE